MPVDVATDSIAVSPIVIVGPEGKKKAPADTWLGVLKLSGLELGDPLTSTVSSAPIAGSLAEAEANQSNPRVVSAAMVPIAQARLSSEPETDPRKRIEKVLTDGGYSVVSEQQVVASKSPVSASVPPDGSIFLNYPLAVTEPSSGQHDQAREAALDLARVLSSRDGFVTMRAAGFRTPNTFKAGNETRMKLTIQAGETGVGLFPDSAQLGVWSFSTRLDGDKDYRSLIPVRRMDEKVDGGTQREALVSTIRGLKPKVGGGTGLYDSTLAAFREVKRTYDPKAINSVIVLTDGANDDEDSISLAALIDTLKKDQDPTQPVVIITIGITSDADAATLDKISAATGGSSFVARDPKDIPGVFVQALQNRAR